MLVIQDEYTRDLIADMLSVVDFAGINLDDLYGADGDRLADAITRRLRSAYSINVTPAAVLATVAEML